MIKGDCRSLERYNKPESKKRLENRAKYPISHIPIFQIKIICTVSLSKILSLALMTVYGALSWRHSFLVTENQGGLYI